MANHNTASLRTFRQHFHDLEKAITPPDDLITRLYSAGLISMSVRDEAYEESKQRCCHCLLRAVENTISINEAVFDKFLSILSQDVAMEELCTKLKETKEREQRQPERAIAIPEIQQSSPPLSLPPTPPPVEGHIHIHVPGSPENNEGPVNDNDPLAFSLWDLHGLFILLVHAASKWRLIGQALQYGVREINEDTLMCFRGLLSQWLQCRDTRPTVTALAEALRDPSVRENELAISLEEVFKEHRSYFCGIPESGSFFFEIPEPGSFFCGIPESEIDVRKAKSQIKLFEICFDIMRRDTLSKLDQKRTSVKTLFDKVTLLKALKGEKDIKIFLAENMEQLSKASSNQVVFGILNMYWTYFQYHLLEHIMKQFSLTKLQVQMKAYKQELEIFKEKTSLGVFGRAQDDCFDSEIPDAFKKLVSHHDLSKKSPLKEVEKIRLALKKEYSLEDCALMFFQMKWGSITIVWLIPKTTVKHIIETASFMDKGKLSSIMLLKLELDGKVIYEDNLKSIFLPQAEMSCSYAALEQVKQVKQTASLEKVLPISITPVPITEELNPENYCNIFHELIMLRQESYDNLFELRIDGNFMLVFENPKSQKRISYLSDMTSDHISLVMQASRNLKIIDGSFVIDAFISYQSHSYEREVLFIEFSPENYKKLYSHFPVTKERYEKRVNVQFTSDAKFLFNFVEGLTNDVIDRLFPRSKNFEHLQASPMTAYSDILNLKTCTDDQQKALSTIVSCPSTDPPVLLTGAFGTGKTHLLALACHYFLQESANTTNQVRILVCTQREASADAFIDIFTKLIIPISENTQIARVTMERKDVPYTMQLHQFSRMYKQFSRHSSLLVVATCRTAFTLKDHLAKNTTFTHILIDEGAQMSEPEAVAPLCLASKSTKIVIAGDSTQVSSYPVKLQKQCWEGEGLSVSLLERLEKQYQHIGGAALQYHVHLTTNVRCHSEIVRLSSEICYGSSLKPIARPHCTHPEASFPINFVCSSLDRSPIIRETPTDEAEAKIFIELLSKYAPGWPENGWGRLDPAQICISSSDISLVAKVKDMLNTVAVADTLKKVKVYPTYDLPGREFRVLFLSTCEAVYKEDISTETIADPRIFNTVIGRARSLVISVGNPYFLLKMEEKMCKLYGEKGKCWSVYLRKCLCNNTLTFHSALGIKDEEMHIHIAQLEKAVNESIAFTCTSDKTFSTCSTAEQFQDIQVRAKVLTTGVPENYTGRLERDFFTRKLLGKGRFSEVYHVTSKTSGKYYALKISKLSELTKTREEEIIQKMRDLCKLNHANVTSYHRFWIERAPTDDRKHEAPWKYFGKERDRYDVFRYDEEVMADETMHYHARTPYSTCLSESIEIDLREKGNLYLIIQAELCGETLKKWLENHRKGRSRLRLFSYFEQILKALDYIHKQKLAHTDLRPSNIFLSREDSTMVKVGGFDHFVNTRSDDEPYSQFHPELGPIPNMRHPSYTSGRYKNRKDYRSLEDGRGDKKFPKKADIYALGMIYIEMNVGDEEDHLERFQAHERERPTFLDADLLYGGPFRTDRAKEMGGQQYPYRDLPTQFRIDHAKEAAVIEMMITRDLDHRPTAEDVLKSHTFEELKKSF